MPWDKPTAHWEWYPPRPGGSRYEDHQGERHRWTHDGFEHVIDLWDAPSGKDFMAVWLGKQAWREED